MSRIGVALIALLFIGCSAASQRKISIENLKESYASKDEPEFMRQFPNEMDTFRAYFGWNDSLNKPQELYEVSYEYIDYWFDLLDTDQFQDYESNIIGICRNGKWEADGVNYFQNKALNYIKTNNRYELINKLDEKRAKSVLFFLFDSPHPKIDQEFKTHLNTSKQQLLEELSSKLSDSDHATNNSILSKYENNSAYFIKEFDVNGDNRPDKIVSHKANQGDELHVFIQSNNSFKLQLESTNFSQDGGCQIVDILQSENGNGMVIVLAFMDGGLLEEYYHISFDGKEWELTNTVFRTKSGNEADAVIYHCNVEQGLNMKDSDLLNKLKYMPDEDEREEACSIESE